MAIVSPAPSSSPTAKTLVLHTDAAGDVTLKFDAIQEIKTDAELHVSLKDGKTAVGPVTTTDGQDSRSPPRPAARSKPPKRT